MHKHHPILMAIHDFEEPVKVLGLGGTPYNRNVNIVHTMLGYFLTLTPGNTPRHIQIHHNSKASSLDCRDLFPGGLPGSP